MRTIDEVKKALAKVEADERLHYPPATVDINAPLALVQVELESKRAILQWVLEGDDDHARKSRR